MNFVRNWGRRENLYSLYFILQADWRSQEIGREKGIWNLNFCWDYNWVHGLGLGPYFCLWAQKVDGPV